MKLEEIQSLWAQDSKIDSSNLGDESLKIPSLHSKYFRILTEERLRLKKLSSDYKGLYRLRHEFFTGIISNEDLKERGWKPNPLKILRSDLPIYLESDQELVDLSLKIGIQEEKLDFLKDIIKSINNRNYIITNSINWLKFSNGLN
jgi:hypothetical protein